MDASHLPDHESGTSSDARLAANRANAQHSTGPRTPEGQARSSQNAFKHGLFSAALGYAAGPLREERTEYNRVLAGLLRDYQPATSDEQQIVDRMADRWWELVRMHRQAQLFLRARLDAGAEMVVAVKEGAAFDLKEARLERSLSRMRRDLAFLQRLRRGQTRERQRDAAASFKARMAEYNMETEAFLRDRHVERERERALEDAEAIDDSPAEERMDEPSFDAAQAEAATFEPTTPTTDVPPVAESDRRSAA